MPVSFLEFDAGRHHFDGIVLARHLALFYKPLYNIIYVVARLMPRLPRKRGVNETFWALCSLGEARRGASCVGSI
jgi:hypothetical protein